MRAASHREETRCKHFTLTLLFLRRSFLSTELSSARQGGPFGKCGAHFREKDHRSALTRSPSPLTTQVLLPNLRQTALLALPLALLVPLLVLLAGPFPLTVPRRSPSTPAAGSSSAARRMRPAAGPRTRPTAAASAVPITATIPRPRTALAATRRGRRLVRVVRGQAGRAVRIADDLFVGREERRG